MGQLNRNVFLQTGYGLKHDNAELRLLIKRKVEGALIITNEDWLECFAKVAVYGDHGVVCKHGPAIWHRHDLFVLGVSELLEQANIQHSIELRHLFSNDNLKPADIWIPSWCHNEKNAAIDICITSVANSWMMQQSQTILLTAAKAFY